MFIVTSLFISKLLVIIVVIVYFRLQAEVSQTIRIVLATRNGQIYTQNITISGRMLATVC